jgi:hypothetical protein
VVGMDFDNDIQWGRGRVGVEEVGRCQGV